MLCLSMFASSQFKPSLTPRFRAGAPHASNPARFAAFRLCASVTALFPPSTQLFSIRCQKSAQLTDNKRFYHAVFSYSCALFSCTPFVFSDFPKTYRGYTPTAGGTLKTLLEVYRLNPLKPDTCNGNGEDRGAGVSGTQCEQRDVANRKIGLPAGRRSQGGTRGEVKNRTSPRRTFGLETEGCGAGRETHLCPPRRTKVGHPGLRCRQPDGH
jgi:hypothetical protein